MSYVKEAVRRQLIEEDLFEAVSGSLRSSELNPLPNDHAFKIGDVRKYIHAKRHGGRVSAEFAAHLPGCAICLPLVELIEKTNPLLTEQDPDEQVAGLIRIARDPLGQAQLESKVQTRLAAAAAAAAQTTGAVLGSAFNMFHTLVANRGKLTRDRRRAKTDAA
jgi:hypothetical protein